MPIFRQGSFEIEQGIRPKGEDDQLDWGSTMAKYVDKFGKAVLFTLPWEELARMAKMEDANLAGIPQPVRDWILDWIQVHHMETLTKINDFVDKAFESKYVITAAGIQPAGLNAREDISQWRANFAEGIDGLLCEVDTSQEKQKQEQHK